MNQNGNDNLTFGALILGLIAILMLLWLLKILLGLFLVVAESIIVVGIYAVILYFTVAILFMLYDHFTKGESPGFVRAVLKFHHSTAKVLQGFVDTLKKKRN